MTTYVFDFCNLYIPESSKYINTKMGIKIFPLKIAEDFENNRTSIFSKYRYGRWKTAKCHIKSNSEEKAKQIATWLEFIYSFAQNRNVFFLRWYEYKKGSKYYSETTKFIHHRENRFPDLIHSPLQNGRCVILPTRVASIEEALEKGPFYNRDISLFIDTSLETLRNSNKSKQADIIGTIDGYIISNSDIVLELRFLISWISIEKLAKSYYNVYKVENGLFNKDEILNIKEALEKKLESILGKQYLFSWEKISNDIGILRDFLKKNYGIDWVIEPQFEKINGGNTIRISNKNLFISLSLNTDETEVCLKINDDINVKFLVEKEHDELNIYGKHKRLGFMKRSINRNFLYEHTTDQKVSLYLNSLDLGFNSEELKKILQGLISVRTGLVHNLNSELLKKNRHYFAQLNKILEQIILRLLGIDKSLEKEFLIKQYDKPTKV